MVRLNCCRLALITGLAQNIQIAAGECRRSVEEIFPGIDGQLKSDALSVVLFVFCVNSPAHCSGQIVVMGAVRQGEHLPCRVTGKGPVKNRSVGNSIVSVTSNRKRTSGGEGSPCLQTTTIQCSGLKRYGTQIARD